MNFLRPIQIVLSRHLLSILVIASLLAVAGCRSVDSPEAGTDSAQTESAVATEAPAPEPTEEPAPEPTEVPEAEPTEAPVEEAIAEPTAEPEEEGEEDEAASNLPGNAGSEAVTSEDDSAEAEPVAEATEEAVEESGDEAADAEPVAEATEEAVEEAAEESGSESTETDVEFGVAARLTAQERNGMYDTTHPMVIDPSRFYYATLDTVQGEIVIQLYADRAPMTVNNFIYLAKDGYYDNTTFHRVIDGFMAQAGDPTGTGAGGPGYEFEDEIFPGLTFDRSGLLAMANRGPATNGSQFFLTLGAAQWLDGNHAIFGEIVEGMEVLNSISIRDPQTSATAGDEIFTITIEETDASILPEPTPPPPTPTPLPTPTPYAPSSMDNSTRPLAQMNRTDRADLFNIAPEMVIDTSKKYTAVFNTNKGTIRYELDVNSAPMATNNLVVVAALGYYDNMPINQVNPQQFVIAGAIVDESAAQPTAYDVGYDFAAETGTDIVPAVGVLAYIPVREGDGGAIFSSGSQLLLALTDPPPQSAEQFSFFGQLTEGLEVLEQLTAEDVISTLEIEIE